MSSDVSRVLRCGRLGHRATPASVRLPVLVLVLVLVLAAAVGGCSATSGPATGTSHTQTSTTEATTTTVPKIVDYLSLGDSVGMWDGDRSSPYLLAAHYRSGSLSRLRLVDMSCSGETTSSMISHSTCARGGSQYRNAVGFLRAHRGDVALVTIGIGGNDVVPCAYAGAPTSCFTNGLKTMQANLAVILPGLQRAAGPGVRFVGMNIFDPLLGDWLAPGAGRAFALEAVGGVKLLNTDMEKSFAAAAIPVANVEGAFDSNDLGHVVSSPWGRVPVAVDVACRLLDIMCREGREEGFGDDPDAAGAVVIAHAFETVIGTLQPPA
ncbi:MAG: SGNH/GDSL hydrolase family protein [Acidimicrobiales bacterium]